MGLFYRFPHPQKRLVYTIPFSWRPDNNEFFKNSVHLYLIVIIRLNESFDHKTNFDSLSKRNNAAESHFLFCKFTQKIEENFPFF